VISLPSHLENGLSRCNLWLVSSTLTFKPVLSDGGGWKVSSPGSNPLAGNSSPYGLSNLNLYTVFVQGKSMMSLMKYIVKCFLQQKL
jgi:hypothetical protein